MAEPAPFSNLQTQEQIALNRKLGQQLMMQGMSVDPVGHWTQGLARVLQAGVGRMNVADADQQQQQRSQALQQALQNSGVLKGLSPADTAVLGSSPDLMQSAYKAVLSKKIDPTQGLPNSVREFQYGQQNPQFLDWMKTQKGKMAEFGKAGAVFQGDDGQFYTIQFGSDGQRRIEPVTRDGMPLRPAKGVKQVGDELVDVGTGAPVRNVAPQIVNREAAEERGKVLGKAQGDLPRVIDNATQALATIQQIREHPGRRMGTGVLGVVPAIPGTQQAAFVDLVNQAKGRAFLEAFNSLKGGGAITEVEGTKATQAIARLERARRPEDFEQALADLEGIINAGLVRAYRSSGANPAQPAPGPRVDSGPGIPVAPERTAAPPSPAPAPLPRQQRTFAAPPPEAVNDLMREPTPAAKAEFDQVFGPGSADAVLKGRR